MFRGCAEFEGKGLETWFREGGRRTLANVGGMFLGCERFDCDLSAWQCIASVHTMQRIFRGCTEPERGEDAARLSGSVENDVERLRKMAKAELSAEAFFRLEQ
eukprot:g20217.t1